MSIFEEIETEIQESNKIFETKSFTYDYEPIVNSDLILSYKKKVEELGDMLVDLPIKLPKYRQLEKEFFEELQGKTQLYDLVKSGEKGNPSQLFRSFVCDGYKIDISGKVIGFVHASLYEGLHKYEDDYNAAVQGRIASIITADSISVAGYIAKKLQYLFSNVKLSNNDYGCLAKLAIKIDDNNKWRYTGRIFFDKNEDKVLEKDSPNGIYHFYSPLYCEATEEETDKVFCEKCCGKLSERWRDFSTLGIIYNLITERLTQRLLSSKHLIEVILADTPYLEYIGDNTFKILDKTKVDILLESENDEYGKLLIEGVSIPFMSRSLKKVGNNLVTDGTWYSLDTNSLLPMVRSIFDKVNMYTDIHDPEVYLKELFFMDEYAKVNSQSILYEIMLSLMNVVEEDQRVLWKNRQESKSILLSPTKAVIRSGNFNSLFFQAFKQQVSDPLFHLNKIDKTGGFYEIYLKGGK